MHLRGRVLFEYFSACLSSTMPVVRSQWEWQLVFECELHHGAGVLVPIGVGAGADAEFTGEFVRAWKAAGEEHIPLLWCGVSASVRELVLESELGAFLGARVRV